MANGCAKNRIYIVGAGFTGTAIAREFTSKPHMGRVVAFLDDDPEKIGRKIHGIPVLGPLDAAVELLKDTPAGEAIIAIPSATREQLARIYGILKKAEFTRIRIVPSISQIVEGTHLIQTREIDPQDLLARETVKINLRQSLAYLKGKRVLITGAGGSIGAELARQLLHAEAERLYLLGHGENSIYEIDRELRLLQEEGIGSRATIVPIIGDLQDRSYITYLLPRLKAEVVFHAAAHKHVPMLEANPVEAVKNNVLGTRNLVQAGLKARVKRFVLVSSDKAVEPTGIYGASKLLAEEIVLQAAREATAYRVVRFGNVLASRGSILPLFRKQILKGGPVTLTHPEARRFFMTIPEAVSLVLQASGMGEAGGLYLLDMGEPVMIREIAEQMIRFYGFEPEKDIPLTCIGLRPGEKLEERLWDGTDQPVPTIFPKILKIERQKLTKLNGRLADILERLESVCFSGAMPGYPYRNRHRLREVLKEAVPSLVLPENEPEY